MSQLKVRDLMTTQVITVKPTDSVRQAVLKFAIDSVSGAPVVDNRNHVIGLITQTDILKLILKYQRILDEGSSGGKLLTRSLDTGPEGDHGEVDRIHEMIQALRVEDVMVRSVVYTSPDAEIIEVLKLLITLNIGRIPVLEKGVLVGTISRSDIIFALYKKKV